MFAVRTILQVKRDLSRVIVEMLFNCAGLTVRE
jgi:hypothetical protein